ncbi:MAG TPA: hypothetical protein VGK47_09620, partial [Nitrososphaeraceae archaeon]
TWYNSLSINTKREALIEAISKFPYLATYMKMHQIKGGDDGFVNHFTFKLMVEVLRGNKKNE